MNEDADRLRLILERLDDIEQHVKGSSWYDHPRTAVVVALAGMVCTFILGLVAADATRDSSAETNTTSKQVSDATIESARRTYIASQRRESFSTLGRTAREQLRVLQVRRDQLDANKDLPPEAPSTDSIGASAYAIVRSVAVDTELVGDRTSGGQARCITLTFLRAQKELRELPPQSTRGNKPQFDAADDTLDDLQTYISDFIEDGSTGLFRPEPEPGDELIKDPECPKPSR